MTSPSTDNLCDKNELEYNDSFVFQLKNFDNGCPVDDSYLIDKSSLHNLELDISQEPLVFNSNEIYEYNHSNELNDSSCQLFQNDCNNSYGLALDNSNIMEDATFEEKDELIDPSCQPFQDDCNNIYGLSLENSNILEDATFEKKNELMELACQPFKDECHNSCGITIENLNENEDVRLEEEDELMDTKHQLYDDGYGNSYYTAEDTPLENDPTFPTETVEDNDTYQCRNEYSNSKEDIVFEDSKEQDCTKLEIDSTVMDDHMAEDQQKNRSREDDVFELPETSRINTDTVNHSNDKPKVLKKFGFQAPLPNCCQVCSKRVYPVEQIVVDLKYYHKGCFKCQKCGTSLSPASASRLNGNVFCKTHYIELFRKRGRYDDIFVDNENVFVLGSPIVSSNLEEDRITETVKMTRSCRASFSKYSVSEDSTQNDTAVFERKSTMDAESCNRVASTRRAWVEGRVLNSISGKKGNSNNNNNVDIEPKTIRSGGKIKNIMALFESN